MKPLRGCDPLSLHSPVETRLGPALARRRLVIEREQEAKASTQGLKFPHIENMSLKQMMIEGILRATGTIGGATRTRERWNCDGTTSASHDCRKLSVGSPFCI
jgi:hypothetical protein